jgi:GTP cyclohydrolase II
MMNQTTEKLIAVERAIGELRAGRPVWVEGALIQSAEAPLWPEYALHTSEDAFLTAQGAARSGGGSEAMGGQAPQQNNKQTLQKLFTLAQLLPEWRVLEVTPAQKPAAMRQWLQLTSAEIESYAANAASTLRIVARAALPMRYTEDAEILAFRPAFGMVEHLAVMIGNPLASTTPPLVRIHSSCLTGDLLGSLRCDCGDQLHLALEQMAAEGQGVLCYLQQEGRGIGIGNKIRAYALQDAGKDTAEANEALGFAVDARDFQLAGAMLKQLGLGRIRLLSNNPAKQEALDALGVEVTERIPLKASPHAHNAAYLATKAEKMRHQL